MTLHAKLSASGSERWLNCAGSVKAEDGLPDSSSPYAQLGTVLHDIAEAMLTNGTDGSEFVGKIHVVFYQGEPIAEALIDEDHIDLITIYVDFVRNLGGELMVEQKVDFSQWVPGGFGTADAVVLVGRRLHVVDLKTGQGNRVMSEDNSQLMLYALGVYAKFDIIFDFDEIVLTIVQPPLDHIDEHLIAVDDLLTWGEEVVKPAAQLALTDDAPRSASAGACKWCKAKPRCREYAETAMKVVANDFKDFESFEVKNIEELTDAELAGVLKQIKLIEAFLNNVKENATFTIESGGSIPGFKLVAGRSLRTWRDEEEAENAIRKKLKVAEAYTKKLISPAQAEKKLGKGHPLIEELTIKPEGKPTLVDEKDKRPALIFTTAEQDFENIETDAA